MALRIKPNTIVFNKILSFLQEYSSLMNSEHLIHICMTSYSMERNLEAIIIMRKSVCVIFHTKESASIPEQLQEIVEIFRHGEPNKLPSFMGSCEELMQALKKDLSHEAALSTYKLLQGNIIETLTRLASMSDRLILGSILAPQPISGTKAKVLKQIGLTSDHWASLTQLQQTNYIQDLKWLRETVRAMAIMEKYVKSDEVNAVKNSWQVNGMQLDDDGLDFMLDPPEPQPSTSGTSASNAPKDAQNKADPNPPPQQ